MTTRLTSTGLHSFFMPEHLRCQVEYQKGFDNYVDTILDVVEPVTRQPVVQEFYFLRQEYSRKFNRHVQLDVFVDDNRVEEAKEKIGEELENHERRYYWEEPGFSTWYGLTPREKELLLENRVQNASTAIETLRAYRNGDLEHTPEELVNRNYHITANQHGMTGFDEFKFCIKRAIQLTVLHTLNIIPGPVDRLYNRIFLRREMKNLHD